MSKRPGNVLKSANSSIKKPKTAGHHWLSGLVQAMEDPTNIVESDDLITVIKDKYPKAECHYLVLPKENISSLKQVTSEHRHLLKHMHKIAQKLTSNEEHEGKTFKIGYHAMPSMARLHLHVISDDMNSAALKTKKHWNSFNSEFFLESTGILGQLEENGKILLPSPGDCKRWLDLPLKCHQCDYKAKNIPDLKKHILQHSH